MGSWEDWRNKVLPLKEAGEGPKGEGDEADYKYGFLEVIGFFQALRRLIF